MSIEQATEAVDPGEAQVFGGYRPSQASWERHLLVASMATGRKLALKRPVCLNVETRLLACADCGQQWTALSDQATGELVTTWWVCPHMCNVDKQTMELFLAMVDGNEPNGESEASNG